MKKLYLFLIILIIILTTVGLFAYVNKVQILTNRSTLNSLRELTKQDVIKIKNTINEHKRILETIINEIQNENYKTPQEVFELYSRNSGNTQFSRLAILYSNGQTFTSDGKIIDLGNEKEEFFASEDIKISQTRQSKVNNEKINIYSQKTKLGEEEVVIMLAIETEKFENMFIESIYEGYGEEYIVTTKGDVIAKSRGNIEKEENSTFFEEQIKQMKNEMQKGQEGEKSFYKNARKYFITYQKLDVNDWYLVIITQGSIVAEELNQIVRIVFIISVVIIIIITLFSLYIINSEEKKKEELYNLAYIDSVTKLGNYNYFNEKGSEILENDKLKNKNLVILDIDKFKIFNKKYGHENGNKLLNEIAKILKKELNNNSIICRISNDIFAIIMVNIDNAQKKCNDIKEQISKIAIENKLYHIYMNIGIYEIKDNKFNIFECFDKALMANRKSKENLDKICIYDNEIESKLEKQHQIENEMYHALEKEEFEVYYQPKISIKDGKSISAEALVRWNKKEGVIPPNEFIPVFEKNGFIVNLDKYIFEKVCKNLENWKKRYLKIPEISINISKENFYNEEFIKEYIVIAQKYNIEVQNIELEITESATISENIDIIKIMNNIKKSGFKIALDDFGTGTSTLNMLQNMPIDTLKIDKTFIDKIDFENEKNNIVEYIIYMAKKLNLNTVAEGVENIKQVEYLKKIDCDFIQGYYFSKPVKAEDFEGWL